MRCESVQGLWPPTALFVHDVRAFLFLDGELYSSLWSGASDGKILRWSLLSPASKEVWAFALLCGHTTAIAGLAACSRDRDTPAVVSVCLDAGVCLWDSVTGRCLKRRHLSLPSAAHPAALASVPGAQKLVCIAYTSTRSSSSSSSSSVEDDTSAKGGIIIMDASSLTVLQTVSRSGYVGAIVATSQAGSGHSVIVADTQGRSRVIELEVDAGDTKSHGSRVSGKLWDNTEQWCGKGERAEAVSLSCDGSYMLLVFRTRWVVSLRSGQPSSTQESNGNAGGCFLPSQLVKQLLVWDVQGGAGIYSLVHLESSIQVTSLYHIPPPLKDAHVPVNFCFIADTTVARIEFGLLKNCPLRGTRVTLWEGDRDGSGRAVLLGCGGGDQWLEEDGLITASMVLPGVPLATAYGYKTGRIEVVVLHPNEHTGLESKRSLLWHTDAILCLAAHYPESEQQVLLSGGMDCCICIWDLKAASLLTVLHQHVAPVRQLILPSPDTKGPWAQAFLSLADDACVAIVSLTTLRVERMFPGHPGIIRQVCWDESRGYLAVSCTNDSTDLLYIWDVHSGSNERVLRAAAAHSMLKHFLGRRKWGDYSTGTSASSLTLPLEEQASHQREAAVSERPGAAEKVKRHALRGGCPFPGIAAIQLDMTILLAYKFESSVIGTVNQLEERLLRTSLSILHIWELDPELDSAIEKELRVYAPKNYLTAAGLLGSKGAMTLLLPDKRAIFELWKMSPDFCSLRVLTMVSLAQLLISISNPGSLISSSLASFYSKAIFERLGDSCRPCLEVYIYFWQDPAEHVRVAARTLFHTAAGTGVPGILTNDHSSASLVEWLESMDVPEWAAASGASCQDARAARIVLCGALVVWYPMLVRKDLPEAVAPLLLKLVRATSDKHSATAAEILSAGMMKIWQPLIQSEIPSLVSDVLSLVQCLSAGNDATASLIIKGLAASLLPSLAVADVLSFMAAVASSAAADPSVYLVGLSALIQVVQASPLDLIPSLGQVIALVLQALNVSKPAALRNKCRQICLEAINELERAFPMVAMHRQEAAKLAVGDPVGDIRTLVIHVYDLYSATKVKLLDASGPPGHPAFSKGGNGGGGGTSGITAVSFSRDGEGLVAFSHQGLVIRWWSLGAAWWEKLSRGATLVHCTKLVLVPPSPAFSPRSSSTSIMSILSNTDASHGLEEQGDGVIDLSFRLEWRSDRAVALLRGGEEVGLFQL